MPRVLLLCSISVLSLCILVPGHTAVFSLLSVVDGDVKASAVVNRLDSVKIL